MKLNLILVSAFFMLLTSCSQTIFHAPVMASTSVKAIPEYKDLGTVEDKGCMVGFLFFVKPLDYKSMYKKTMEAATDLGGDALIDFQIKSGGFTWLYPIFFKDCWEATGTAVKFTGKTSWDEAGQQKSAWEQNPEAPADSVKTKSKWDQ